MLQSSMFIDTDTPGNRFPREKSGRKLLKKEAKELENFENATRAREFVFEIG